MNVHTGRKENVMIRVKPEIKELLEKLRMEGFNVSEWFEENIFMQFIGDVEKLSKEKDRLSAKIKEIDKKIKVAKEKDELEAKLTLKTEEIRQLNIACSGESSEKTQWGIFCNAIGRKFALEEFRKLRKSYVEMK